MITAIRVTLLVLDNDEERVRRYGIGSIHDAVTNIPKCSKRCNDFTSLANRKISDVDAIPLPCRLHHPFRTFEIGKACFRWRPYAALKGQGISESGGRNSFIRFLKEARNKTYFVSISRQPCKG